MQSSTLSLPTLLCPQLILQDDLKFTWSAPLRGIRYVALPDGGPVNSSVGKQSQGTLFCWCAWQGWITGQACSCFTNLLLFSVHRFYSSPYSLATNRMIPQTSITPFIAASPVSTYQVRLFTCTSGKVFLASNMLLRVQKGMVEFFKKWWPTQ